MTTEPLLWLNRLFEIQPIVLGFFLAGLFLAFWARLRVARALKSGQELPSRRLVSGGDATLEVLEATGLLSVAIEPAVGAFGSHYDLETRSLRLSPEVFEGHTISAIGLCAHQAGHAIQHDRRGSPMPLWMLEPLAQASRLGVGAAWMAASVGFLLHIPVLVHGGLVVSTLAIGSSLLGLPLERDASRRGRRALAMSALVESGQEPALDAVLDAACWMPTAEVIPWRRRRRINPSTLATHKAPSE